MRAIAIAIASLSIGLIGSVGCEATVVVDPNGEGGGGGGGSSSGAGAEGTGGSDTTPSKQYPKDPPSYDLGYYQWVDIAPGTPDAVAIVGLEDGSFVEAFQVDDGGPLLWSFGADLVWSEALPVPGIDLQPQAFYLRLFEDRGALSLVVLGEDSFLATGSREQMTRKADLERVFDVTQHPDGSLYGLAIDTSHKARIVHWVDGVEEGSALPVDVIEGHDCEARDGRLAFSSDGAFVLAIQCGYSEDERWLRTGYRDGAWREVDDLHVYRIYLAPHDGTLPTVGANVKLGHYDNFYGFANDAYDFENLHYGYEDAPMGGNGLIDPWQRPVYTSPFSSSHYAVFVATDEGTSWLPMPLVDMPADAASSAGAFQRTTGRPAFASGSGVWVYQTTPQP